MRRLLALWLVAWMAFACVGGNATPHPSASPADASADATPVPVVSGSDREDRSHDVFRKGPDAGTQAALPTSSPSATMLRSATIVSPIVTTIVTPFPVSPMATHPATAADLDLARQSMADWSKSFVAMLDRRHHPQPGVDPELDLRNMFSEPRAAQVVVRSLAEPSISGEASLTMTGWRLNGALMRSWGSPAFLDVTVTAHDHSPAADLDLGWRLRVQPVGFWYRVIDLYDPAAGAWMIGDGPRYSPIELGTELSRAAAAYLSNESYSAFRPTNAVFFPPATPFSRVRSEAVNALNRRMATGALTERYFERVTASIERFEPAWFGGDGVVTISLRGTLIETVAGGRKATSDFTQHLKFLRVSDAWTPVDAQEDDGSWDSGGDLALAEVARPHG